MCHGGSPLDLGGDIERCFKEINQMRIYGRLPRFIDAAPHPVLFNSIQKKVLKDYCAVNKRLVCSSWENDGSQELAEAQNSLKIENFERCIRETKTDVQIKNWFELNRGFISQEYSVAQTLYKRYESHIEELVEQILDSPKIYLEI